MQKPQKTTLLRICCIYMYNSNVCTCIHMCVRACVHVFVCFCFYMNKLYVYKLLTPTKYTHTYNIRFCISCQPNQPIELFVRHVNLPRARARARARVTHNLDEKICQVGISFDGEFILFIFENFWHLMGSYYWKSSHVT